MYPSGTTPEHDPLESSSSGSHFRRFGPSRMHLVFAARTAGHLCLDLFGIALLVRLSSGLRQLYIYKSCTSSDSSVLGYSSYESYAQIMRSNDLACLNAHDTAGWVVAVPLAVACIMFCILVITLLFYPTYGRWLNHSENWASKEVFGNTMFAFGMILAGSMCLSVLAFVVFQMG